MSCSITEGFEIICGTITVGGVAQILVANFNDLPASGIVDTGADGTINTITMTSPGKFYDFQFEPDTSTYTENMVKNENATFIDQTITIRIPFREAAKRQQLLLLTHGKFRAIVKDVTGKYFLLGEKNGLKLTKADSSAGTKKEDGNGYVLEFKAIGEFEYAKEVVSGIVDALIA